MAERREIKQRSPAVWARVQEAYLAGEPARSVARRFDVGYGNLRYRANAEGWTRKAAMARADTEAEAEAARLAGRGDRTEEAARSWRNAALAHLPPEVARIMPHDPEERMVSVLEAITMASARAAWLLSKGRAVEANALIAAIRNLSQLTGLSEDPKKQKVLRRLLLEMGQDVG